MLEILYLKLKDYIETLEEAFGVKDCDVFLGFIRPFYGSGVLEEGGLSITHIEFETAYERNIPRFILADISFLNGMHLIRIRQHLFQIMANELKMPHLLMPGIYCFVQALISVGLIMTDHRYLKRCLPDLELTRGG